jgi:tetratricopeptide (TPR) repeat protein
MKKISVSLFLLFNLLSFSQEKEIKEAFNTFESGNKSLAQSLIQQVESTVRSKSTGIDPDIYAKYLYIKGNSLLEQGKTLESAKIFSKLALYEKGPIYSLKNKTTKEKAFVLTKDEAEKLKLEGFISIRETKSGTNYIQKIISILEQKRQELSSKATSEYNAKQFSKAADDFLESYYLTKASGNADELFKYYAAISYHAANNNTRALELYLELLNEGYTGKTITYTALQNGKRVSLSEEQYNLFKSAPNSGFSDFKQEESSSVEADLYNYAISLLIANKRYDEAMTLIEKGLHKFPNNDKLQSQMGELYYQTGQTDKYITKLKESVQKNPNDYTSYYNLGVIYSKDPKTISQAKEYYTKALNIKPDYPAAYLNMAALLLSPDKDIVVKMKSLGSTSADQQKYDALVGKRVEMFKQALPYLEKAYGYDKKDKGIIQALKEAYRVLQIKDKWEEMKKAESAL